MKPNGQKAGAALCALQKFVGMPLALSVDESDCPHEKCGRSQPGSCAHAAEDHCPIKRANLKIKQLMRQP